MAEADRRLREVAQLRKIWRAFQDPQDRAEDERLARDIIRDPVLPSRAQRVQEVATAYGLTAVRAAVRYRWCRGDCAAIVELDRKLGPQAFEEEPLIRVYVEAARTRLAEGSGATSCL